MRVGDRRHATGNLSPPLDSSPFLKWKKSLPNVLPPEVGVVAVYEIIEWIFAVLSDPSAGAAFLGSQGDQWDAQKDMLADGLGAIAASALYLVLRRPGAPDRSPVAGS